MKRIIVSASRRTDVPAFYADWFMGRIRAGFAEWIQPFSGKLHRVELLADRCAGIVFWTRNPEPMLPYLDELRERGYAFYFHVTITGYPRLLEPYNPPLERSVQAFRALSARLGPDAVMWRYDPIIISSVTPAEWHRANFQALCLRLAGATRRCYFSFVSLYRKAQRRFQALERAARVRLETWPADRQQALARELAEIAGSYGIDAYACCMDHLVGGPVRKARCVDLDILRELCLDGRADLALRRSPSRPQCGCSESVDIGAYDTCAYGCVYCYATQSHRTALARRRAHRPGDTLLWRPGPPPGRQGDGAGAA